MSVRLADLLERCVPAILDEWGHSAAAGELRVLCAEDRVGDLAAVLHAMSVALRPHALPGAVDLFIETAAAHGARRRAQGVHEACLFEEYDHLGTAVPRGLRACESAPLAPEDIAALEGGITTAILAGLRGFHRGEFERRGTWADVLARTADDVGDATSSRRAVDRATSSGMEEQPA